MQLSQNRKERILEKSSNFFSSTLFASLLFLFILPVESRDVFFHITKLSKATCSLEGSIILTNGKLKKYEIKDKNCLSKILANTTSCHIERELKETSSKLEAIGSCEPFVFKSGREIIINVHDNLGCSHSGKSYEYASVRENPPERVYINRAIKFRDEDCLYAERLRCFIINTYTSNPNFIKAYGRCSLFTEK